MKSNSIIFPIIILLFANSTSAQWTALSPGVTDFYTFASTQFVNDSTGFIAACDQMAYIGPSVWSGGYILKTTDRGNTWTLLNPWGMCNLSVFFVDVNIGYTSTEHIMKTIDGGTTWFFVNSPGSSFSRYVYFINDSIGFKNFGYGASISHAISRTINGGLSWYPSANFNPPSRITSVFFTSSQVGFAVGHDSPLILKTIDAGATWNTIDTTYSLLSVHFPSQNIGYAVGFNGTIVHTTNSGNNWSAQSSGVNVTLRSIYCLTDNICYAVGDSGIILKTIDGGINWLQESSGTTKNLYSIYCTYNNTCFVAGDSATILRNTNTGVGIIEHSVMEGDIKIFPNPSVTELTIQINPLHQCQFELYNSSGQKLIDKIITAKTNTVNISSYSNGIYFYRVNNDDRLIKSGKIIKQ